MVKNRDGNVTRARHPDPRQFEGVDAAFDSAGYVAMARYLGGPWAIGQHLDLVQSYEWAWYTSLDYCVEREIATSTTKAHLLALPGKCQLPRMLQIPPNGSP